MQPLGGIWHARTGLFRIRVLHRHWLKRDLDLVSKLVVYLQLAYLRHKRLRLHIAFILDINLSRVVHLDSLSLCVCLFQVLVLIFDLYTEGLGLLVALARELLHHCEPAARSLVVNTRACLGS